MLSNTDSNCNYSLLDSPDHPVTNDTINAVNILINERTSAREKKDYGRADMLLNQLLTQYGVILNDADMTWRVGTKKRIKKRIAVSKAKFTPSNSIRSSSNDDTFQLSSQSGINVSTLSEDEILTLLTKRRTAQQSRDYEKADNIRNSLKSAGVYIEDGLKEYRYDGIPFKQRRKQRDDNDSSSSSWNLKQSHHSLALPSSNDTRIVYDLLQQRSNARSKGDYAKSDYIRDQLYESYNIRIDDRLREWSVGGHFGNGEDHWTSTNKNTLVGYNKSEMSKNLPTSDEVYIQSKVDERMRAKRTRNYELADTIRDELYDTYDVTIHDKMNLWSAGGEFGEGNSWNHNVNLSKRDSFSADDSESLDPAGKKVNNVPSKAEEEATSNLTREQLEHLTVVQLKNMLRNSGRPVSGTKSKLISRLLDDGETNTNA